jgi:NAD(P)-dependent dehydrogenase (short-subunit alcohol dehydrogenase family)
MNAGLQPLAVVTGASSGIGLELAREYGRNGLDLIVAADRPLEAGYCDSLVVSGVSHG